MELMTLANIPAIPSGLTVTVYEAGTSTLATLYDRAGASLANPFASDSTGRLEFQAATGKYDLKLGGGAAAPDSSWNGGQAYWVYGVYLVDGLGTASTHDVQISPTDTTADRLMKVGAFGLGASAVSTIVNANDYTTSGFYTTPSSGLLNFPPGIAAGRSAIWVSGDPLSYIYQLVIDRGNNHMFFRGGSALDLSSLAWRRAYSNRDIIGAVSQTSGVPTGAIIERGSNSNGEYTKFADGTLICTMDIAGTCTTLQVGMFGATAGDMYRFTLGVGGAAFPVAFAAIPKVSVGGDGGRAAQSFSISSTALRLSVYSEVQDDPVVAHVTATGRWY